MRIVIFLLLYLLVPIDNNLYALCSPQCVEYARDNSTIKIDGNANTWWNKSVSLGYSRGSTPRVGSILVFSGGGAKDADSDLAKYGHVAIVSEVVNDKEIKVDHANWTGNCAVYTGQTVKDDSTAGNWSKVRVWWPPAATLGGTSYTTYGFIYPKRYYITPIITLLLNSSTSTDNSVQTVTSSTGRVWMDRNLGASRVATSLDDSEAYGDLYQWGRGTDGHEKRDSGTTSTLSGSDTPGHGNFILPPIIPYDWRTPQNDNLWQKGSGINNPCPDGFRLPTETEWEAERASWLSSNAAGAFGSPLKLVSAGYRFTTNTFYYVGSWGYYWTSTVFNNGSLLLHIDNSLAYMISSSRANGVSVRCIKD